MWQSLLLNSDQPYAAGEASEQHMTWFGNYDRERWKKAVDACEGSSMPSAKTAFIVWYKKMMFHLVNIVMLSAKRNDGGTTETLISVHQNPSASLSAGQLVLWNAIRWGGYCPTKEYFDMFPMADGSDFDWNNPEHTANPFVNRDPRLNETFILDGDIYQGRTVELTQEYPSDKTNYPKGKTGQGAMIV
ncbi:MAG: RagB/SusD family nutrient uptake outer membrane protein [Bacteroides intestinalis]